MNLELFTRPRPRIVFLDKGPDSLGRRAYFLEWVDCGGIFRPELDMDGHPVGWRRAQAFFSTAWAREARA